MKNRIDEWITVVAFCAFIGIMSVLYLVLPKQDTSELEKRPLEKAPQISMEALTSGEWGSDVETYMSDHIPVPVALCDKTFNAVNDNHRTPFQRRQPFG